MQFEQKVWVKQRRAERKVMSKVGENRNEREMPADTVLAGGGTRTKKANARENNYYNGVKSLR